MGYFGDKRRQTDKTSSFEQKQLEYLYRISKQLLNNLKIILICIESYYPVYRHIVDNKKGDKENKKYQNFVLGFTRGN